MTQTGVLQEIRQMRFEELYERRRGGRLTQEAAAEILGVEVRTFRRWSRRYEVQGAEGLADRRLGRLSARRAPVDQVMQVPRIHHLFCAYLATASAMAVF